MLWQLSVCLLHIDRAAAARVSETSKLTNNSTCHHEPPSLSTLNTFVLARQSPQWAMASSFTRFLDHTQRRSTVGRTPLDEWSARRRDLYLTMHDTHNRQTSMPSVVFEPTIPASERPQTYALDGATTGTGPSSLNIQCITSKQIRQ
jgi:hypothetical protein